MSISPPDRLQQGVHKEQEIVGLEAILKDMVLDDKLYEAFTKHRNVEGDKKVLYHQGGDTEMDASFLQDCFSYGSLEHNQEVQSKLRPLLY